MVPTGAQSIGDFNPATGAFSVIDISGVISHGNKYRLGVLAPNGHIYMVPCNADGIGDFNPATGVFKVIGFSSVISHAVKYYGGVLAPNGHIYMVPYLANSIGKLHLGSNEPAYKVAGGMPVTWGALMSPHFNKY